MEYSLSLNENSGRVNNGYLHFYGLHKFDTFDSQIGEEYVIHSLTKKL